MKFIFMAIFVIALLTGCAPKNNVKAQFQSRLSASDKVGRVIVSSLDISKYDLTYALLFGVNPLDFSVYDITEDIKFIGLSNTANAVSFLEYNSPIGRRTFMLTSNAVHAWSPFYHTDFIEVDVTNNKTTQIAVSQSGLRQMPYFHELLMKDEDFDFCSQPSNESYLPDSKMSLYMSEHNIDLNAKYFKKYCNVLSSEYKKINSSYEVGKDKFESNKDKIQELKNKDFPVWQKEHGKQEAFDLAKPI